MLEDIFIGIVIHEIITIKYIIDIYICASIFIIPVSWGKK